MISFVYAVLSFLLLLPLLVVAASHSASKRGVSTNGETQKLRVVVMGAAASSSKVSPEFRARLNKAVEIAAALNCELGILGFDSSNREVRDCIEHFVKSELSPSIDLRFYDDTENTRKAIMKLKRLMNLQHFDKCIVVSSNYHAFRIKNEAMKRKCKVSVVAPGYSPESSNSFAYLVRILTESVAFLFYLLPVFVTSKIYTGSGSLRQELPNKTIRYLTRNQI